MQLAKPPEGLQTNLILGAKSLLGQRDGHTGSSLVAHAGSQVSSFPGPLPTVGDGRAHGLGFSQVKVSLAALFLCDTEPDEGQIQQGKCNAGPSRARGGSLGEAPGSPSQELRCE